MPDQVEIKFVPAAELKHYEIALWLGSLFASAAVGFWTAYLTTITNQTLSWVALVFSIFTIAFIGVALYYRSKLKSDGLKWIASLDDFK